MIQSGGVEAGQELQDVARQITAASDRMGLLIDDLLEFGRVQSGKLQLSMRAIALEDLVSDVVMVLGVLAAEKRQRVTRADEPRGLWVQADPRRIEQVLINLIHNALKYSPADSEVTVSLVRSGDGITVQVSDQGPGISPEHQRLLFSPFYRGAHTESAVKGIGLGLAIAQGFIAAHGGRIGVESELGKGTTFWFTLPAHQPPLVESGDPVHHGEQMEAPTLDRPVLTND